MLAAQDRDTSTVRGAVLDLAGDRSGTCQSKKKIVRSVIQLKGARERPRQRGELIVTALPLPDLIDWMAGHVKKFVEACYRWDCWAIRASSAARCVIERLYSVGASNFIAATSQ